jgi:ActR/RegA family two-component response regulator
MQDRLTSGPRPPASWALCDVRLHDGCGTDVFHCLRAAQPDLGWRFVFVTGDLAALEATDGEFARMPVLAKPFSAADLDRVLAEVEVSV